MLSTPQDLNRFIHDLFSYNILEQPTLERMLPTKDASLGYGIRSIPFYEEIGYGYGDDLFSTHSMVTYDRPRKVSITYLIDGASFLTNDFALGIKSILYDKAYEYPTFSTYGIDPSDLSSYEGTYIAPTFSSKVIIFMEENQPKISLSESAETSFVLTRPK